MIIAESSRISTISNTDDLTNKFGSSRPNFKKTFQGTATSNAPMRGQEQKTGDDLNDWQFCNPDKSGDRLPQPYR